MDVSKMSSQELIELATTVNAELHARLTSIVWALSNCEQGHVSSNVVVKLLLEKLRGG